MVRENDAHHHGQRQPDPAYHRAMLGMELPGQYRDEDDVVDPQDDLEGSQGGEGDEVFGIEPGWHGLGLSQNGAKSKFADLSQYGHRIVKGLGKKTSCEKIFSSYFY
jgi:hypothetical protein